MIHEKTKSSALEIDFQEDLPPLEDLSDEELVTAHLQGRPGAFRALHRRFERRLSHFILGKTGNPDRVQDLLQDTWVRVARHLPRFDTSRRFSTWVYTIAANLCKNELRNRSRSRMVPFRSLESREDQERGPLQFEDLRMMPDRLYEKRETRRLVEDTVQTLSENHRKVFQLREIRGKSYREVARILGLRIGTVKSRLHRARTQFAARIGPLEGEEPRV